MQYKQTRFNPLKGTNAFLKTLLLAAVILPAAASAQTTYLPQGAKENNLLERMEIKASTDSILNFSKVKPFSRKQMIPALQRVDSIARLSKVDAYNLYTAQLSNIEFAYGRPDSFLSKKPFLKSFYKTPANFYEVNTPDFFLALNPVFQYTVGKEQNSSEKLFHNTRGISLRAIIGNKIGVVAYITDNQERDPAYVREYVSNHSAVPGAGYYKNFKNTGYDYFDARGYITFNATKFIDVSFGYDKNFIGNGYRSLFLSDFANNALFLKLNTRIWKFNYQNIFMELVNAHTRGGGDLYLNKKYAAIHHLDIGVTKWLNVGLFESVVFGRTNHFEFGYLNPVIFYRSAEQQNGSFDNALVGLDAKANLAHHVQVYGQLLLDEFKLSELKKKWWANKFGFQGGVKYIDAFGVQNLDLQVEVNRVRPFTYSHYDSVANYTHDNLPLAHPLGANFNEFIGIVRYQPAPKMLVEAKAMYYKQGRDTTAVSYGSNIFLPNGAPFRTTEYGYEVGSGALAKVGYASVLLSYELKPNFFIETTGIYHTQNAYRAGANKNSFTINAGVRWNMHRREFAF